MMMNKKGIFSILFLKKNLNNNDDRHTDEGGMTSEGVVSDEMDGSRKCRPP